ncbi:hypothetical protein [Paenibacillus sp. JZ16]|nr:hypothetical protein [Paenibacillus sp. JZ16]
MRSTASLPEPREPSSSRRLQLSTQTTVMHSRLRVMANSELQLP